MNKKVLEGFKKRYKDIHPLIFQRSIDHAKSEGELFDILENLPEEYPIVWDEKERNWVTTDDLLLGENFKE
jgi:hypothetical protein